MKVIRVIKIILLVIAIICVACTGVGNFFVLKDACDNSITADEVHEAFDEYKFSFGNLFQAKAEGEDAQSSETTEAGETSAETTEADETADEPTEVVDEPIEDDGSYKAGNHLGVLSSAMKFANARLHLSFLDNISINLCKAGVIGIRNDGTELTQTEGGEEATAVKGKFEVNLLLAIAYVALTLAFILHLISKKKRKNLWSIILMIFGYLLFSALFACGNLLANLDINKLLSEAAQITDFTAYRIYTVTGATVLGGLLGLGFIRTGSRAMKRIKKKSARR